MFREGTLTGHRGKTLNDFANTIHMSDRSPDGTVRRFQWLVNPGEPPRRDVRVSVADGTVVEICDVPGDERSLIEPTALLPKFVNAHTHLEFSRLLMPLQPPIPFTDWIRSVIGYRRSMPDIGHESVRDSIATGLDESASAGIQLIGEITTSEIDYESLWEANGGQVNVLSFRELIGL